MTIALIMQHICASTTIEDTMKQVKGLHEKRYTKEYKEGVSTDIKQSVSKEKNREGLATGPPNTMKTQVKDAKIMSLLRPHKAVPRTVTGF
jgi:hypothetical protein